MKATGFKKGQSFDRIVGLFNDPEQGRILVASYPKAKWKRGDAWRDLLKNPPKEGSGPWRSCHMAGGWAWRCIPR